MKAYFDQNVTCRRSIIQKELDGNETCCLMPRNSALCDICTNCTTSITATTTTTTKKQQSIPMMMAIMDARKRENNAISSAQHLFELLQNYHSGQCILCIVTMMNHYQNNHPLQSCPYMRNRCLNHGHKSMNCPVPSIRYAHGACINCGLSGGITLSIAFHTDDDNFGGSCTLAARDRLLSIS